MNIHEEDPNEKRLDSTAQKACIEQTYRLTAIESVVNSLLDSLLDESVNVEKLTELTQSVIYLTKDAKCKNKIITEYLINL